MRLSSLAISLMLIAFIHLRSSIASVIQNHKHVHLSNKHLAGRDTSFIPTTTVTACESTATACVTDAPQSHLPCDKINGTDLVSDTSAWTLLCDTDFYAQDIYPFVLAGSFDKCMSQCEDYNINNGYGSCAGFVFAPDRVHLENDCYLKSGLKDAIYPGTIHLIGATLHSTLGTATSVYPITVTQKPSSTPKVQTSVSIATATSAVVNTRRGRTPTVIKFSFLGTSVDNAARQYVSHLPAQPVKLSANVLQAGVNIDLITEYGLATDTGTWNSADILFQTVSNMTVVPRISRDGGRGGIINGTNVFIFCDTSTFGQSKDPVLGYLNGFVSSSVAVDHTMNAHFGRPLQLDNTLGQWQDDVGRMRGFAPMTVGEEAFNIAVSGQGYRYAVWPNSSPIILNDTHAIIFAPLVYLQVDMQDQSSPRYTSLGNTLLLITIDPTYGPHADRLQNQFFRENEVSWGSLGGIRAWSSSGRNSLNGSIYVFGQAEGGVLIGKVSADSYTDRSTYKYWNGNVWSNEMPPSNATADTFLINQPVMNMDLIYSPAHMTFIMIYLTPEADNTFYYRYLVDRDNTTLSISLPYESGGNEDYVENLIKHQWSEQKVLFTIPAPVRGYVYAGGVHAGYFGEDDVTNGGLKMLCTWTEHTKVDPNVPNSGYAHKSQVVKFGAG